MKIVYRYKNPGNVVHTVYAFQKPLRFSIWALCGLSLGVGVCIYALLFITVFINKFCM